MSSWHTLTFIPEDETAVQQLVQSLEPYAEDPETCIWLEYEVDRTVDAPPTVPWDQLDEWEPEHSEEPLQLDVPYVVLYQSMRHDVVRDEEVILKDTARLWDKAAEIFVENTGNTECGRLFESSGQTIEHIEERYDEGREGTGVASSLYKKHGFFPVPYWM